MGILTRDDWKRLFEINSGSFFDTLQTSVKKKETEEAYEAVDYLTDTIIYFLEMKKNSALEELLPHLENLVFQFFFLSDASSGMYVLKGKIEALLKFMKFHMEVTPDTNWLIQLRGKYDQPILLFLYQKNIEQMTRIADYLSIKGSQLTPIMDRLEDLDFIMREKEGKNVWCRLTKKGHLVAKYLYQSYNPEPIIRLIQEIRSASERPENIFRIEHIIEEYRYRYPEYLEVIKSLRELLHVTIFSQKTAPAIRWNTAINPEKFISVPTKGQEFSSHQFIEFKL